MVKARPFFLPGLMGAALALSTLQGAIRPDKVEVRVSVKRVLSVDGAPPTGPMGAPGAISSAIVTCNEILKQVSGNWTLALTEIVDAPAASAYYVMSTGDMAAMEAEAMQDPEGFSWRDDAVNIYVLNEITNAGGSSSFPTAGAHRHIIIFSSKGNLGGGAGWLHEIGHYFNLLHTHEFDAVDDTVFDPPPPSPLDCAKYRADFLAVAEQNGYSEEDTYNTLYNVMSYRCDYRVLTPLQLIRMRRALFDHRLPVRVTGPEKELPTAAIGLPPEAQDGVVTLGRTPVAIVLDGGDSKDGLGGRHLTFHWSIAGGPEGGAWFATPASGWEQGASGIGYGNGDDLTVLSDMKGSYVTVYLTREFLVPDVSQVDGLTLDVAYGDGLAAHLNGEEVARRNLSIDAGPDTPALSVGLTRREVLDLSGFLGVLREGANRVSIEVHGGALDSWNVSIHPVLSLGDPSGERTMAIPSRACWYYQKGLSGPPPPNWKLPEFDPGAGKVNVVFALPGEYRLGLLVDDGYETRNTRYVETVIEVLDGSGPTNRAFLRGDCNGDGELDIADPLRNLIELFHGTAPSPCPDACDGNDDGRRDLSDSVFLLDFLFRHGTPPPPPFPASGADPTADDPLSCPELPQ